MITSKEIKDAIEIFGTLEVQVPIGCKRDFQVARYLAIKALEKQMPKKPTYDGDGYAPDGGFIWGEWLCPNCGSRYEVDYDVYVHCPNCGQAIDWSEEE